MPYANNQGVQIYYEVVGDGPPITFVHGALGNTTMWAGYGYVDRLREQYKLILIDARGHGKSTKLYDPAAYDSKPMVDDVIAVLDELGITQTHYWGYSMGGYMGFGLAKYYPHRLHSLILGGTSPYVEAADPTQPDLLLEAMHSGVNEGVDAMIAGFRAWGDGYLHPTAEDRLRSLDPRAMVALLKFWPHKESLEAILPTMTMPCLLYIGDNDGHEHVLTYAKQMPNAATLVLPRLNHAQTSAAVDLIVPRALAFLATGK